MAGQIRKGDEGTSLKVTVMEKSKPYDASASTIKTLSLKKPSGSVIERPVTFATDGKDGVVVYVTTAEDLDEAGSWQGQVFLKGTDGGWHTEHFSFQVGGNL